MGERQSIAQKGVRAIDVRNSQLEMGILLQPQPPHTRQKYEQKYGPQTAEFALF